MDRPLPCLSDSLMMMAVASPTAASHHQQHLTESFARVVIGTWHSWFTGPKYFLHACTAWSTKSPSLHQSQTFFLLIAQILQAAWMWIIMTVMTNVNILIRSFQRYGALCSLRTPPPNLGLHVHHQWGRCTARDHLHLLKVLKTVNPWCRLKNWTDPRYENKSLVLMLNIETPEEHAQWRLLSTTCIFVLTK